MFHRLVKPYKTVKLNEMIRFMRGESGITSKRGSWKFLEDLGKWCFSTYHPSYVIRCEHAKNGSVVKNFEKDIEEFTLSWQNKIKQ